MAYPSSYHQTQHGLQGDQVQAYTAQAGRQEDLILSFFRSHPSDAYSPETIQEVVLPSAPITSVRRAMTNLTEAGYLRKTDRKELGRYGRPVGTWVLAKQQLELF